MSTSKYSYSKLDIYYNFKFKSNSFEHSNHKTYESYLNVQSKNKLVPKSNEKFVVTRGYSLAKAEFYSHSRSLHFLFSKSYALNYRNQNVPILKWNEHKPIEVKVRQTFPIKSVYMTDFGTLQSTRSTELRTMPAKPGHPEIKKIFQ